MRFLFLLLLAELWARIFPLSTALSVATNPAYFDDWCEEWCSSWKECNDIFDSNYVDLRLRIRLSIYDGPGKHLIQDKYFGTTISRQSFETQFVLDVATALETSPCRLHITSVFPEGDANYWDTESVFVAFRLFPADASLVAALTTLIQEPNSRLYDGQVTRVADTFYGLKAQQWDHSLKLMYSIPIVGGSDVVHSINGKFLNQGSMLSCRNPSSSTSKYCIFEAHIINDFERVLGLKPGQISILFVKEADLHSVIVSFRLIPEVSLDGSGQDAKWVTLKLYELSRQMSDPNSMIYSGNVTFKIDPTWGISGFLKQPRSYSKYLSRPYPRTSADAYERCKATHRCPRALSRYNQSSAESHHMFQEYQHGQRAPVPLFLDFEDWRQGIRGWEQSCRVSSYTDLCLPSESLEKAHQKPAGAHWSPFEFSTLGPKIPTFGEVWNNGLVLNKQSKELDITDQMNLIEDYSSLTRWMDNEFHYSVTNDALLRSRIEIRNNITNLTETIATERTKLAALVQSQCTNVDCNLLFNTSNARLSGAVNATGVITTTPDGTEVALWVFDSIDIDENVNIFLTGQRAMALVSRSSARINAKFIALPGTLGGFPGGFSVGRRHNERLVGVCREGVDTQGIMELCDGLKSCCPGDVPISELAKGIMSNNVNGPGSPSSRVYLMTLQTSAPIVNEIQTLTTSADQGQTLSGGFRLHFNGYTTPLLRHDITAGNLKRRMEDSLNRRANVDPANAAAGIGVVDVSRESFGSSGGYRWKITFVSTVGSIGQDSRLLTVTNLLQSKGAKIAIESVRQGNGIGGGFSLNFMGEETDQIRHDVTASELRDILLQRFPSLTTVHVLRSDPTRSGGYTWTLTLTTKDGNVSPFSPTSSQYDTEGIIEKMTASNYLTGCVDSRCPTIQVEMGHSNSHNVEMRSIVGTKPFSLAFGGGGAGFAGIGGDGFGDLPAGNVYGDQKLTNLHGGSGGAVGVNQPFQLGIFKQPRGRGGSGGGAIEIVAANDIILGSDAIISCNGEAGADSYMSAGGGGSGGSILLSAGGVLQVNGKVSVNGGAGGKKQASKVESFGGHGGGGSGGRIALFGQSVMLSKSSTVSIDGGKCSADTVPSQECTGGRGGLLVESAQDVGLSVDDSIGAEGTRSSLCLSPRTVPPPLSKRLMSTKSSPEYDLGALIRPSRVTFHFRVETSVLDWDAAFELRESRWSYIASKSNLEYTTVIGIVVGQQVRHGVNYIGIPSDDEHVKQLNIIKPSSSQSNSWTKVDIRIDWAARTHDVYIDDVRLVQRSPFRGEGIRTLSMDNFYRGGKVWFDEIYVGKDTTMGFVCPSVLSNGTLQMERPMERGWKVEDIGETSSLRPMQRHESHVSRRAIYQRSDNKFIKPYDGQGENNFTSNVKSRSTGDKKGQFHLGSLLRLHKSQIAVDGEIDESFAGVQPHVFVWYGEHDNTDDPTQLLSGAVMACSTDDFITWKNEGAMLHFVNVTDMVNATSGPFRIEQPKVLYNNSTAKYVMWMIIDNGVRELGMAGVAVSDYYNGPFEFVRSFYPDGNRTRDQTLFQDDDGTAYLFRTYYDTVEYVLPKAVMQPTWESVKNADGSINFALSYHRAEYEPGYDNYHDIYLQRWRTEDQPWKVICINRLTLQEREVPYGKENLNSEGDVCHDPFEYKKVLGQGHPMYENSKNGIQSRFLDPNDPKNNVWIPNSVPSVKGQTWKANFEEGTCGMNRKVDDDMQLYDPELANRKESDRSHCSNIVDNPIHPTVPDKRIGPQEVVERRRAKYVAVSRLTDDYLDTSGIIQVFEGELEGAHLLSLVRGYNENHGDSFGWTTKRKSTTSSDIIGTTYQPPIRDDRHFAQARDWEAEHHQYEKSFNDQSFYSTAHLYDGDRPGASR